MKAIRLVRIIALAAVAALTAAALSGCGAKTHQVVSDSSACLACHAADFAVDWNGTFDTKGAVYSATGNLTVTVTGAKRVYVCQAVASNQGDNLRPIPLLLSQMTVTEGEPTALALDAGAYLIQMQEDGDIASQLVIVDPATGKETVDTIALKL